MRAYDGWECSIKVHASKWEVLHLGREFFSLNFELAIKIKVITRWIACLFCHMEISQMIGLRLHSLYLGSKNLSPFNAKPLLGCYAITWQQRIEKASVLGMLANPATSENWKRNHLGTLVFSNYCC
jgi:hypothetical protein